MKMKLNFKKIIFLFIALTIFAMAMEYIYAQVANIDFEFPARRYLVFGLFSIIYGFWDRKEEKDA